MNLPLQLKSNLKSLLTYEPITTNRIDIDAKPFKKGKPGCKKLYINQNSGKINLMTAEEYVIDYYKGHGFENGIIYSYTIIHIFLLYASI